MTEKTSGPSLEKMIGLGAAGLLLGLVVGALAFQGERPPTPAAQVAVGASAEDDRTVDVDALDVEAGVEVAEVQRPAPAPRPAAAAREPAAAPERAAAPAPRPAAVLPQKGVTPALRKAIEADRWFRKARVALHEALGTGALAQASGLTTTGKAIVARVEVLEDHGLPTMGYNVDSLKHRIEGLPSADEAALAELEAHLGKALVRLVLDYRIIRKAGPTRLVDEAKAGTDPKHQARLQELARAFAAADTVAGAHAVLDPPHDGYAPMLAVYKRYRDIVAAGGCPRLPITGVKPGDKGKKVEKLQERLKCEGLFDGPIDGEYGDALLKAVQIYQRTHELDDEGLVLSKTIESMNVPMERRLEQVSLALQRLRETQAWELDDYRLIVNIPAFELRAVKGGKVVKRHRVIVGSNRLDDDKVNLIQGHLNRTRLFTSRLYSVIINPVWFVPERIAKGELKGKMEEDPNYLEKVNIRKKTLSSGTEVLVQGRGEGNALGKVKFLLEDSNAIYLHDTDKPWLFNHRIRAFSHGCMRVHHATDFAEWLLVEDGYDAQEVSRSLGMRSAERGMRMHKPVSFMTEYVTVHVGEDGHPMFLTDVYGYDRAFEKGQLPPRTRERWGAVRLRPHWVPRVPYSLIKQWRAEGKSAPRDPKWKPPATETEDG